MTNRGENQLFADVASQGEVECLGLHFSSLAERREHFSRILKEKLRDGDLRAIEGYPLAEDETVLRLSDPPHYTACPNPFVADFVQQFSRPYDVETDSYHREPFATDVSEGKNDTIYMAHSYHTKVPYKAIIPYILHYTEPGDIVFDGFCGSGMTGVAATLCGQPDADIRASVEARMSNFKWGPRLAVLTDLSPAASFIAYNYNTAVDVGQFVTETKAVLRRVEDACGQLYRTSIPGVSPSLDGSKSRGRINYMVWSEVFTCSNCTERLVFWDHGIDKTNGKLSINSSFPCPKCQTELSKRAMESVFETSFDPLTKQMHRHKERVPVLISYLSGKSLGKKSVDEADLRLLSEINLGAADTLLPLVPLPNGTLSTFNRKNGMTYLHHYYTPRNFLTLSKMVSECQGDLWRQLMLIVQSVSVRLCSMLTGYQLGKRGNVPMTGTLYVGSLVAEANPLKSFEGKVRDFTKVFSALGQRNVVGCGSSTDLRHIPSNSVDYIYTDPPFGDNLNYAQLNSLWDAWLACMTNAKREAIVDRGTGRNLEFYEDTLKACIRELNRILKPGRWMTVVFHNSKNAVWNAIQLAIWESGFVVADVRTLDKKQGTPKQVNSQNAVKQDLVISAYKPSVQMEQRLELEAGTPDSAWDFIRTHLRQLPVFVSKDGQSEVIAERQNYLLFDRMVAFHVQRGVRVSLSAAEFYAGLEQRFPFRDGMYFLPDQAAEYDKKRMTVKEVLQLQLFVSDEASAIQWLKQQFTKKPQTAGDLNPKFMKEIGGWQKNEKMLELDELLEQNFLRYDGKGEVPSQIHSYLSSNFKELRNLAKDNQALKAKARDRWYVPDPNKAGDLEKLRERALMREFWEYVPAVYKPAKLKSQVSFLPGREPKPAPIPTGKKMKVIRLEAVRVGFKYCWQNRDYLTIIAVARRIPENILREDSKLLMWYDQAVTRTRGDQ